jgi:CheY-like chemotaxis protein
MSSMETAPLQSRSVIVSVDDDEDDIDLMRLLFRKAGIAHPVQVYQRSDEMISALSAFLKKSVKAALPLLCFLDIRMPGMGGHEILQWIRRHPQLDSVSVVMLSASDHPDDVKRAAEGGAQCYLAKYPQPAVLRRVVEEAERVAENGAAREWFGLPANLLLRWGLPGQRA